MVLAEVWAAEKGSFWGDKWRSTRALPISFQKSVCSEHRETVRLLIWRADMIPLSSMRVRASREPICGILRLKEHSTTCFANEFLVEIYCAKP